MPSLHQINANRENATHSTGPRTEAGKAASSRNHLTAGLYTRQDYVRPEERELYKEFCETMLAELEPETLLEQSLAAEITGATWRLRRCSAAEAELADYALTDPLLNDDEATEKKLRSIERARASAHSLLHRSINQLRKLQTSRENRFELSDGEITGLAIPKKPAPQKAAATEPDIETILRTAADRQSNAIMAKIMASCAIDPEIANETWEQWVARTQPSSPEAPETSDLASNCELTEEEAAALRESEELAGLCDFGSLEDLDQLEDMNHLEEEAA
jgi:hypothetical protein